MIPAPIGIHTCANATGHVVHIIPIPTNKVASGFSFAPVIIAVIVELSSIIFLIGCIPGKSEITFKKLTCSSYEI